MVECYLGKIDVVGPIPTFSSMKKKYKIDEVIDIVDIEGLGYAVQHYLSADEIANKKLAKLWAEARKALEEIELLLMIK